MPILWEETIILVLYSKIKKTVAQYSIWLHSRSKDYSNPRINLLPGCKWKTRFAAGVSWKFEEISNNKLWSSLLIAVKDKQPK